MMVENENRAFLERRAREERELAAKCEDVAAKVAHEEMAAAYERRLSNLDGKAER